MQINEFKSIIKTFADPGVDILYESNKVVFSVNDTLITAEISTKQGDIYIAEDGAEPVAANRWILKRLARLDLLANRLKEGIKNIDYFVPPSGMLSPTLAMGKGTEAVPLHSAIEGVIKTMTLKSPLETMVLYLTSDAGEGKTSLINQLAHDQATRFTNGEADWLLVPVQLGGRHFLRFDDITIGALQNKYRFPYLYYNSFLALVKMGVIVPAFDGFEEMFVESSSGEAVSAMGILVASLDSQGAILVAARKAYYEFENLKNQESLFDSIRTYSVGFGKVELSRWNKEQFLDYCKQRKVPKASQLYESISDRLESSHPLLTRAVLVKRLIDITLENSNLDSLLDQIQISGPNFFSVFVKGIIEREANEKWIDRSGENDVGTPLLTIDEHCSLLSHTAMSMWESRVGYIKKDLLDFVADYYCESNRKSPSHTRQIRDRLSNHALLVPSKEMAGAIEFDHDEFRFFFLGEGIGELLMNLTERNKSEVHSLLRRGTLPEQAMHALTRKLKNIKSDLKLGLIESVIGISHLDVQTSHTHENCSDLIVSLLSELENNEEITISSFQFNANSLRDKKLSNIFFNDCFFCETSLENSDLVNCRFEDCKIVKFNFCQSTKIHDVSIKNCSVEAISIENGNREYWEPEKINNVFQQMGFKILNPLEVGDSVEMVDVEYDIEINDLVKITRYFMRSTHISESVIKIKLGTRSAEFISDTIPGLLRSGLMIEVENRGGTDQRRFKLGISWQKMNECILSSNGDYKKFLELVEAISEE